MIRRVSVSEITTVGASFADDVANYAAAGAEGIGIWEVKLTDDDADVARLQDSGLKATHCVPTVPSILPLPRIEGPVEPEERVQAVCASVRRLAAFDPVCVLFLTGPRGRLDDHEGRAVVVEGLRTIAAEAERVGVPIAVEPIQREYAAELWSIVSTVRDTVALLDEAECADVGVMFDTWHLWNDEGLFEDIDRYAARFPGVHVADWRQPTRNTDDRALPGEGVADLPRIIGALETAGYAGWYDVEIFSDVELPDSLWREDPSELSRRAVDSLRGVLSRSS